MLRSVPWKIPLCAYVLVCVGLWNVPLLNVLHVESSAVLAGLAFLVAGLSSLAAFGTGQRFARVLAAHLALLSVPLALMTAVALWVPNCAYGQGVGFFVLFAGVSVVLSCALAYAIDGSGVRLQRTFFVIVTVLIAALGPLLDVGFYPQFYSYNHVFGGVLGPIYDESIRIRPAVLAFRGLSLLWAAWLFLAGRRLRAALHERALRRQTTIAAAIVALLIGCVYWFAPQLGIVTPATYLRQQLGGHRATPHFDLYYRPGSLTEAALERLVDAHEYRYHDLSNRLGFEVQGRIQSYIYPDVATKERLTGSGYTSVAPVWLSEPQMHMVEAMLGHALAHELAHVFSREFGMPVLRASLSVGLVEGFAVAVEPADGIPSPHEQVLVASTAGVAVAHGTPALAASIASRLSPLGFWTGRGAVSYTTTGSFVRYLLDAYGVDRFKRAYAFSSFEPVYGKSLHALASEWEAFIREKKVVHRAAHHRVVQRFAIPSIFEKHCPHHVADHERALAEGQQALIEGDSLGALAYFEASIQQQPLFAEAHQAWASLSLARGRADRVVESYERHAPGWDSTWTEQWPSGIRVTLGDAFALKGEPDRALLAYRRAWQTLSPQAHTERAMIAIRMAAAGRQHVLRALFAETHVEKRMALLEQDSSTPSLRALAEGIILAGQEDYAKAKERLERANVNDLPIDAGRKRSLERQRLVWLAQVSYLAHDLEASHRAVASASDAFTEAGDLNQTAALNDFARRIEWRSRSSGG